MLFSVFVFLAPNAEAGLGHESSFRREQQGGLA